MTTTIPQWTLADRLHKSLRASRVGTSEMADYLGVGRNTVSTWTAGKIKPSVAVLRAWALRTGVDYEWLLGDGEGVRRQGLEPRTRWLRPSQRGDFWWSTRGLVSAA